MIGSIFDKLFAYGDDLQAKKAEAQEKLYKKKISQEQFDALVKKLDEQRKIVHECQSLVQEAWDESYAVATVVNKDPENDVEALALSVLDISVLYDATDKKYFYELDGFHFDSPTEVLKYVIKCRKDYRMAVENNAKAEALEYLQAELAKINFNNIKRPSTVLNAKVTVIGAKRKAKPNPKQ